MAERAVRFFTFQDPALRHALVGSMLLGICCGLMGAFLVVRKLALMGDALSHAALPGICIAFLLAGENKSPFVLLMGAAAAACASSTRSRSTSTTSRRTSPT